MKTLWIDLLCFSSAAKAVGLNFKQPVEQVYYINIHKLFKPFVGLLAMIIGRPVVQVLDIVESESRIADMSLYETIQRRLTDLLNSWSCQDDVSRKISAFCQKNGFGPAKYREHLKEAAYFLVFRPVEMQVLAEKMLGLDQAFFVLRSNPLKQLLRNALGKDNVFFHSPLFLSAAFVERRAGYYYDKPANGKYYSNRTQPLLRLWFIWLAACVNGLIFGKRSSAASGPKANVGVELIQGRVRLDDITDLYWLKDSGIEPKTVCGLVFEKYDKTSLRALTSTGIRLYRTANRLIKNPFIIFRSPDLILVERGYFSRTIKQALKLLMIPFLPSSSAWALFQEVKFALRARFWASNYRQLGIKLLWTMYDSHEEKLIKAQAMTLVDGLYLGSHWSNFPMYRVDNQKCYDVLFTWGKHFVANNYSNYPYAAVFQTGYPSDHYFNALRPRAGALRNESAGRFVISFQDNIMANDLPYSRCMQVSLHQMFLELLAENDELVVLLKPKRKHVFEQVVSELPKLIEMMAAGRVRVFLGETARSKAMPAEIGMASDLVIGLGISTTAAECCFAGTVSFHADLTGFINNAFGNAGLNKVVFRDIVSLKTAVEAQIAGKGMSVDECRKYHKMLDPFQDGQAYKRTGFVIKKLQEAFQTGLSREEAVKSAQKSYKDSIAAKEAVLI